VKTTILQGAFFPVPTVLGGAVEKLWYGLGQEFARLGYKVTHVSRSHPGFPNQERNGVVHYLRVRGEESTKNLLLLKFRDLRYTLRALRVIPDADILVSNTFWLPTIARNPVKGKIIVSVEQMPKGQMRLPTSLTLSCLLYGRSLRRLPGTPSGGSTRPDDSQSTASCN
jgi:hypothetical protein